MKKLFALGIMICMFTAVGFSQSSATASAAATILTPIAISKTVDMNFGNLASSGTAGTCILATTSVQTATGGVTIMTGGTPTAASFTVTGASGATYTIELPDEATTVSNGTDLMTIDTWNSNPGGPGPGGTGTLTGGTSTLLIGATLHVLANQPGGVYNTSNAGGSGEFTVRVNYE